MSHIENKLNMIARCLTADNEADRQRARESLQELMTGAVSGSDCEAEIRRILLELGVPDHIKGHRYLVEAIRLAVAEPDILDAVTKELYPRVAKAFDTTPARTERAIRHAIETGWVRGDLEVIACCFGNTVSVEKGKPTNSEFIARIANMIRQEMKNAA